MKQKLQTFRTRLLTVFVGSYAVSALVQLSGAAHPVQASVALPAVAPAAATVLAPAALAQPVDDASLPAEAEPGPLPKIVAVDLHIARRADDLRPEVKHRLQQAADALPEGVTLLVTSAYRTTEEQESVTPTFGIKAKPGTSTHEDGRGIDLNVLVDGKRVPPREQQEYIGPAMAQAGFAYLGAADPVHYSVPAWKLAATEGPEPILSLPTWDEVRQPGGGLGAQVARTEPLASSTEQSVTE